MSDNTSSAAGLAQPLGRRGFLRFSAASAAAVALAATGCGTDPPEPVVPDPYLLALPAGDKGLLYYGYLLSNALHTVYLQVVLAPPADLTAPEQAIVRDLRYHHQAYRELLRYYIDPASSGPVYPTDFKFNTSSFNLTTRAGVLAIARQFEDLMAAALPPFLSLFSGAASTSFQRALLLKALSVQARHAATVRDLLAPGSFADATVVGPNGQLLTKTPTEVVAALAPYHAPYVISVANLATPL